MSKKRSRTVGLAAAGVLVGLPMSAHAQTAATVREIVRVVKTSRGGAASLEDARVGTTLAVNDRIRTGGRSAAGLRFQDQSLLRVGELSEVVVTSPRQRSAQVVRGKVFANFRSPGTISGGYAIAAVRGTKVHYINEKNRTLVRCYRGRTFVGAADNPIAAGTSDQVTGTTLTDDDLQGLSTDFSGGEIRFTDGPYAGQFRPITAFNAETGVVTFGPALPGAGAGTSGYLLVKDPSRRVVELTNNTGTTVRQGQNPTLPYTVPHEQFAMLDREPFFLRMYDGMEQYVYPGSDAHDRERDLDLPVREAIRSITDPRMLEEECGGEPIDDIFPDRHRARTAGLRGSLGREFALATESSAFSLDEALRLTAFVYPELSLSPFAQAPLPQFAQAQPPRPQPRGDEAVVREGEDPTLRRTARYQPSPFEEPGQHVTFRVEPYALGSDEDDAYGVRTRVQASDGDVFGELGYRYGRFSGKVFGNFDDEHDVSEGFIHTRGPAGEFIVGRQHLFLGPSNNNTFGILLDLESSDAAVYRLPLGPKLRQEFGYIWDSRSVDTGGYRGAYARGRANLWRGTVGYSLLETFDDRRTGWSLDASQAVIPNVLDIYAEGGENHNGRMITTAGVYLPSIYQKWRVDTFLEYGRREGKQERVSLRLRKELGNGLQAYAFVDQTLGGSRFVAGGGMFWSLRFR